MQPSCCIAVMPSIVHLISVLRSMQEQSASRHFRAIWISDLHLGTAGCQAEPLLEFLKQHESDTLYLVGDIIDGWQLRRRWLWPQSHNDVIQKILRKARKGTRVVFRSEEHTSELQSLMRISYAVFCLKKKNYKTT